MLQHFQYQSLYEDTRLPGWRISFYLSQQKYTGIYHADGSIEWTGTAIPDPSVEAGIKKQIHDLMIFHVYDQQR